MSLHQSPVPSPHYATLHSLHGVQTSHGVPLMPFNPVLDGSTPNATAFAANAAPESQSKGMPRVGTPAPPFTAKAVIDGRIKDIDLASFARNQEWLILIFIPMAWSFICPTEIRAFDRRVQEFETRTCAVVFCSTDSEYVLRAWNDTAEGEGGLGDVRVPLISDRSHRISRDYGVLIEREGVAQRAMFIIDPRGVVRQVTTNDANVGRSVDEARRLLDALEFTDEFGEGCPIDWKKGDRGLSLDAEAGTPKTRPSAQAARPSLATAAPSPPQRPKHSRTNTWSGWLAGRQGSASNTGSPGVATPTGAAAGSAGRNGLAAVQNAQHRLASIQDSGETAPRSPGPGPGPVRQMGSMGGYFDSVVSPLEQPTTVLSQMMREAH